MKYPYSCFSSHFWFQVIVVLSLCSLCCFWSLWSVFLCTFLCRLRVVVSSLPLSFLDTYSLCHLLHVRPSSLVFLFSAPFVEVLPSSTSRMAPSFFTWVYSFDGISARLFAFVLFSCSPEILFKYFPISSCLMVSAFTITQYLYVSFSPKVLIFSWVGGSIPFVICRFRFFIISMAHFSIPNSIPISRLYIPTACIIVSNSFSFLINSLMSFMYIRWLTFFCDLISLYPPVHFLSTWLSGMITISNSNGDNIMVRKSGVQSQVESYRRRKKKMVLDTTLLNTQHYKVRIKGKVEQSREWSNDLPYTSVL